MVIILVDFETCLYFHFFLCAPDCISQADWRVIDWEYTVCLRHASDVITDLRIGDVRLQFEKKDMCGWSGCR